MNPPPGEQTEILMTAIIKEWRHRFGVDILEASCDGNVQATYGLSRFIFDMHLAAKSRGEFKRNLRNAWTFQRDLYAAIERLEDDGILKTNDEETKANGTCMDH